MSEQLQLQNYMPHQQKLFIAVAVIIFIIVIVIARNLLTNGQPTPGYFVVPRALVSSSQELSQTFQPFDGQWTIQYPGDWIAQTLPSQRRRTVTQAERAVRAQSNEQLVERDRVMFSSSQYPFECSPDVSSLEQCAGKALATGAFLDVHTVYYATSSIEAYIAEIQQQWPVEEALSVAPIIVDQHPVYQWKGLECGGKCLNLRGLIIPLSDHQALQLFASVYVNESVNQQQLSDILRRYNDQMDAMIQSIRFKSL